MFMASSKSFTDVYGILKREIIKAPKVKTERWQGVDVRKKPDAVTQELRNVEIEVPLFGIEKLDHWRKDIRPNTPWADDHFKERVGGEPLNPGKEWENWPWATSADKFRTDKRFNHTYMERLWPKFARRSADGTLPDGKQGQARRYPHFDPLPKFGTGFEYGDLQDLVELLAKEPFTRQAYIPLFFPEDTGRGDGGRKVCTLGYQFLVRMDDGVPKVHIWYPLRSCDLIHHWPDDCYMAVRLLLWVIDRCREVDKEFWQAAQPGTFAMHCTSLHVFVNDIIQLKKEQH
jgi:thymidylate synthase